MKILSNHKNTSEVVYIEEGIVFKESKAGHSEKIAFEESFYRSLSTKGLNVTRLFPEFFGSGNHDNKNYIQLEFLDGYATLSDAVLQNEVIWTINEDVVENVLSIPKIMASVKISGLKENGKTLFLKLYIDRVQERLKDALKNCEIAELESKQSIIVNGEQYTSLQKSFSSIVENPIFRSILEREQKPVFFHGDLHFENILIKQNSALKVVDPNGAEYGLISYDYGKLLHSALGKYSLIQDFRFTLQKVTSGQWLFEIQEAERHRIISQEVIVKMKEQLNALEFLQALFACWCHMIALISHHIANGKQQHVAFYLQALKIGQVFCEALSKYGAWETVSQKNIFDNKRMAIREDVVRLPDGTDGYYTVWDTCRAVAIVAIDNGKVLLKREYRHPVSLVIYDLPGGGVEAKENILDAAKRELYEETGFVVDTARVIGSFYMDPGRSNREIFIVLAESVKIKEGAERRLFVENDAFINYGFFDIPEVLNMIKKGEIKDNSLITGMFFVLQETI